MSDEPTLIELDGEGSALGIQKLVGQLHTFTETLDGGRYVFEAEIREVPDNE